MTLSPGTLNNQFLMDVWLNNHFPCKDVESSNWNNHKELVVWSSRVILTPIEEVFEPQTSPEVRLLGVQNTYSPGIWRILDV